LILNCFEQIFSQNKHFIKYYWKIRSFVENGKTSSKSILPGTPVSNPDLPEFCSIEIKNRFRSLNLMFTVISNSFYLMFGIPNPQSVLT